MDVVSTIFSLVEKGMQAIAFAQSKGYLGGSTNWTAAAMDGMALFERGREFFSALLADPAEYDRIDALPQPQKEAEIKARVYPTALPDLIERVRGEMGG